ncbi:MAG: sulfatase-like hydrolase/transferase [Anaerolineales bacterium]
MNKPVVLHPLLFASFPVLSLLAQNLDWVSLSDAARALIISIIAAAVLFGLSWLILRDPPRAGLIATLLLLIFFSYGHLYGAMKEVGLGATIARHRYMAPMAAVLTVAGLVWIIRSSNNLRPLTRVLNVVSAALLLIPVISFVGHGIGTPLATSQDTQRLHLPVAQDPPDIYYIVVDGYGRQDTLEVVYEFDNVPFLDSLEEMGFYVAQSARSNYAQTSLALASALNMEYVDVLIPDISQGRDALWNLIKNSEVRQQLEDLGYETVAFSTGLEGTEWRDADLYLSPATLDELAGANAFESMLAQTTTIRLFTEGVVALPRLVPELVYPYEAHRSRLRNTLDGLAELPAGERPRLVFAHLILPHPPFVFNADGLPITPDTPFSLDFPSGGSEESYLRGYRDQVRFLNEELERIIPAILAKTDTTPVIVIQADHGPDSNSGRQGYVQERMTILNALLLPGGAEKLYPHITPVNTFRVVFNQLFGGDYERLPDRALYSEYQAPYEFIDVTAEIIPP